MRALLVPLFLLAAPAHAEPLGDAWCAPGDRIEDGLRTRLGAVKRGEGLRDPESTLALWEARDGGWTLVVSYADGRACVVGQGEAWEAVGKAPS